MTAELHSDRGEETAGLNPQALGPWEPGLAARCRPGPAGVSPDGRIALVSEALPRNLEDENGALVVTVFSRDGDAIATWPAPDGLLTWAGVAFDGSRFVALVRSRPGKGPDESSVAVAASADTVGWGRDGSLPDTR